QHPAADARRAAPAVLADKAWVQDDEVPRVDDVHGRAAGRILGGSGVSMVRRCVAYELNEDRVIQHGYERPDPESRVDQSVLHREGSSDVDFPLHRTLRLRARVPGAGG